MSVTSKLLFYNVLLFLSRVYTPEEPVVSLVFEKENVSTDLTICRDVNSRGTTLLHTTSVVCTHRYGSGSSCGLVYENHRTYSSYTFPL